MPAVTCCGKNISRFAQLKLLKELLAFTKNYKDDESEWLDEDAIELDNVLFDEEMREKPVANHLESVWGHYLARPSYPPYNNRTP